MKINALHVIYGCALLALAAGIGLTAFSVRQAPLLAQRLKSRVAIYDELQAMKRAEDRYQAAVRMFEALSNSAPASLADLAAASVSNSVPDIRELETKAPAPGWTLRRAELIFNEMSLDQLPAFLAAAESQRPPWRLAECAIAASTQTDGHGRVVLVLETIGKAGKQEALK